MAKTIMVLIKDITTNLFVRHRLNQDHVLYLAELKESGIKLPPILITTDKVLIDGRHRLDAHDVLNLTEIEAEVVDINTESELIAEAYKANVGGSLPPTQQDTEQTVMLLLDRGETIKKIIQLLGMPASMARKYIGSVKSKAARQMLMKAATAITDGGLTVAKAAEQYNVDVDKLKEVLSGRRKKHKNGIEEVQRNLTATYKSISLKNAALMRSLFEKYEDGDVSERQVSDILTHMEGLQKRAARTLADAKARFDAVTGKTKKVS